MWECRGHVYSNVLRRFAQLGTAHAEVKDPSVVNLELSEVFCVKPEGGQNMSCFAYRQEYYPFQLHALFVPFNSIISRITTQGS